MGALYPNSTMDLLKDVGSLTAIAKIPSIIFSQKETSLVKNNDIISGT